jgi:4-hydroxymandelate oxidase
VTVVKKPPEVDLAQIADLHEFERLAVQVLSAPVGQYVQGGAGRGIALAANEDAWHGWGIYPKALADVSSVDTGIELLGTRLELPVLIAPSGSHGLLHEDGELATAAAAREAGTILVYSVSATRSVQEAGTVGVPLWMQLYWGPDRGALQELLAVALEAGVRALCLTVDMPARPWLHRPMLEAAAELSGYPGAHMPRRAFSAGDTSPWVHDARLTWKDLEWLRSVCPVPLVLKGIMRADDARLAYEHGLDALIVSNHGGRALDDGFATAEVLPEIVAAVDGRAEVLVDGGIRSGADVLKALALGARAVLVGRPVLWGLAVGGSAGAARVLEILRGELESVMAHAGVTKAGRVDRNVIGARRT